MQVFHSKCEIFKSNHDDIVSTQSVMNVCKVLQLQQWCTYHAEGDSQRQVAQNGPHSTRPFNKTPAQPKPTSQPTANNTKGTDQEAKPPDTDAANAAPNADADPKADSNPKPDTNPKPDANPKADTDPKADADPPASPAAQPDRDPPGKGKPAAGVKPKDKEKEKEKPNEPRGKRRLPEQPAGEPSSAARKVVHEPSPEPAPPAADDAKPPKKNGAAAAGKRKGAGDAEGSDDGSERESSPMVFLCRHAYDAKRHKWVDEEVPLYCVCCMPYNPDLDMVECARCGEWCVAHPTCKWPPGHASQAQRIRVCWHSNVGTAMAAVAVSFCTRSRARRSARLKRRNCCAACIFSFNKPIAKSGAVQKSHEGVARW